MDDGLVVFIKTPPPGESSCSITSFLDLYIVVRQALRTT